jgi:hypothetical protein
MPFLAEAGTSISIRSISIECADDLWTCQDWRSKPCAAAIVVRVTVLGDDILFAVSTSIDTAAIGTYGLLYLEFTEDDQSVIRNPSISRIKAA